MFLRTPPVPAAPGIVTYCVVAGLDIGSESPGAYSMCRNAKQLRCPYCGEAQFRLRAAGRWQPYFACEGCGQMLAPSSGG